MHAYIRHINSFHTFNTVIDQYLSKFYQKKKKKNFISLDNLQLRNFATFEKEKKNSHSQPITTH